MVDPLMLLEDWAFSEPEPLIGCRLMFEVYLVADSDCEGRVTVPVLWDKREVSIVNNESAAIIRMLKSAFNGLTGNADDFYPQHLRSEIENVNERVSQYQQ